MLYQLSYTHQVFSIFSFSFVVPSPRCFAAARPAGLEPATLGLEGRCSIRLSYGRSFINKDLIPRRSSAPAHKSYCKSVRGLGPFGVCGASSACHTTNRTIYLHEKAVK